MSLVDKDTFAYWVTHPHDMGVANLSRLEETAKAYPYCQIAHSLLAKLGADAASPRLAEFIPRAAAYALDRGSLRRLVESDSTWSDSLFDRMAGLPLSASAGGKFASRSASAGRHSFTRQEFRENAPPYGHDKPISLVRFEDRFTRLTKPEDTGKTPEIPHPELPVPDESVLNEKAIETELTYKRLKSAPIPTIDLIPPSQPRVDERRKQQEIIEAFIKKDPRIGPIRFDPEESETQSQDLTHRIQALPAAGLVTESFAKILVRQGKVGKAIDVYEKLSLKSPEKSDYFAQKIAELKELGS